MAFLSKEQSIFIRDEKGDLLPQKVVLDLLEDKPEVILIPLTSAQVQQYSENIKTKSEETMNELILKHCINPKFTETEAKDIKLMIKNAIMVALFAISLGKSQEDLNKEIQKNMKGEGMPQFQQQ